MDEISLIIRRARRGNNKSIDLSHRSMTSVPNDLFNIQTLENLNLSHNLIVSIPERIVELENLKILDLSHNNISSLPAGLGSLTLLVQLNLENNPIGLGNLQGNSLKARISSQPQPRPPADMFSINAPRRPNTPGAALRPGLKEEDKVESRGSLQGISSVNESELALGEIISQGGFSVVQKGVWKGTAVAVKVIVDPVITQELRQEFENEVLMLNYLRHPYTVMLMGACFKPPHFLAVFEYVPNGSLFDHLHKSREEISLERKIQVINQICEVLLFYHLSGVVHRDLKSMNILLDNYFNIKICDFGLARFRGELNKGGMQFSGTPAYMAPELFRKQSYDEKVDVFAFGTILWEILTRQVPYDGLEPGDIREKVLKGDLRLDQPMNAPRKLINLIETCRHPSPQSRPSFQDISKYLISL